MYSYHVQTDKHYSLKSDYFTLWPYILGHLQKSKLLAAKSTDFTKTGKIKTKTLLVLNTLALVYVKHVHKSHLKE